MSKHRNLMTVCFAAVFALGLAACSSSNDDPPAADMTDTTDTTDTTDMTDTPTEPTALEPTEMQKAQTAAMEAATAAMTAAGNAKTAADEADEARTNAATLQTGETSGGLAEKAREYADAAHDAYTNAKAASGAAAATESLADAIGAKIMAENARDAAQAAETKAVEYGQNSMDAAGAELLIDGTVKTVLDTTIDAVAPNQVITTTTGGKTSTADTGFQGKLIEETTGGMDGRPYAAAVPDGAAEMTYRQDVAARDVTIGKTVDSADDTARLAIITSYAGSKTVKVFAYNEADPMVTRTDVNFVSTTPGKIITAVGADNVIGGTDDTTASLKSLGTFYLAGAVTESNGLSETDEVAADAKPLTVYSYLSTPDVATTTEDETVLTYLVEDSQRTEGGTTVYVYRSVVIIVDASRRDGPDEGIVADAGQVTANVPEATDYEHIHFGLWASLNAAGTNTDGIGIGFVQNYAGAPTEVSDMPNHASATFNGNWVATIQAADPDGNGSVSLEDGVASMAADFEKMTIEATLTGLATLSGDISGNTFSGTKVSDIERSDLSSDADDFMGSTSGGFFGTRAAEAGGVFSFTSDGNEDGAFSGAFGGTR